MAAHAGAEKKAAAHKPSQQKKKKTGQVTGANMRGGGVRGRLQSA